MGLSISTMTNQWFELDTMERGRAAESHPGQMAPNQPQAIPDVSIGETTERLPGASAKSYGTGIGALAMMKISDQRLNHCKIFESAAVRVVDEKSLHLTHMLDKLGRLERKAGQRAYKSKRIRRLMRSVEKELDSYFGLFIKVKTVLDYDMPTSIGMRAMIEATKFTIPEGLRRCLLGKRSDFRMLGSVNVLDSLVRSLPGHWFFELICYPFRTGTVDGEGTAGQMDMYSHGKLVIVAKALIITLISTFMLLPLSLLSFQVIKRLVGGVCIILFNFALIVFIVSIEDRKTEIHLAMSFAYGALMWGFLANITTSL